MIEARHMGKKRETDRQRKKRRERVAGETAVFICCLVLIW